MEIVSNELEGCEIIFFCLRPCIESDKGDANFTETRRSSRNRKRLRSNHRIFWHFFATKPLTFGLAIGYALDVKTVDMFCTLYCTPYAVSNVGGSVTWTALAYARREPLAAAKLRLLSDLWRITTAPPLHHHSFQDTYLHSPGCSAPGRTKPDIAHTAHTHRHPSHRNTRQCPELVQMPISCDHSPLFQPNRLPKDRSNIFDHINLIAKPLAVVTY